MSTSTILTNTNPNAARRVAVYSSWLYLAGPTRGAEAEAAWKMVEERFGGLGGVIAFWAEHVGLPAQLAEVVSGLIHATAHRASYPPEVQAVLEAATAALWVEGDLTHAAQLLEEFTEALEAQGFDRNVEGPSEKGPSDSLASVHFIHR